MESSEQYDAEMALSPRKQPVYLLNRRLRIQFFPELDILMHILFTYRLQSP
jgi:hypothetical protein